MKNKCFIFTIVFLIITFCAFAQERKPVIGLGEVTGKNGEIAKKLQSYLSQALVQSGRFDVMERSSEEINKLSEESMMQGNGLASVQGLDFLLISKIVDYESKIQDVAVMGVATSKETVTLGFEVKFIDVSNGKIVLSEVIRDSIDGNKSAVTAFGGGEGKKEDLAAIIVEKLSKKLIAKIVDKLYPSTILSISKNKVMMIPNLNYEEGNVIDIFELGEEIIDPYTLQVIGQEETLVAKGIVFEINNSIAKIMIDPANVKFKKAVIEKGMLCRKSDDKNVTKVTINKLKKLSIKK